ncbi:MAG: exosortase/archaeosortase family protein, partial [Bacteroidia bacterium]
MAKTKQNQLSRWWKDRSPVLRFLLAFLGLMLLFYLFFYSPLYRNFLEKPFLSAQASISNFLLNLFGYATSAEGGIIRGSDFTVNIKNGCDGLEAMAIFISGILIFPTSLKNKLPGLGLGLVVLFVLNIVRIVALYIAGLYVSEETFEL